MLIDAANTVRVHNVSHAHSKLFEHVEDEIQLSRLQRVHRVTHDIRVEPLQDHLPLTISRSDTL